MCLLSADTYMGSCHYSVQQLERSWCMGGWTARRTGARLSHIRFSENQRCSSTKSPHARPQVIGTLSSCPKRTGGCPRAETWQQSIWCGRLEIHGKGPTCLIRLLERDSSTDPDGIPISHARQGAGCCLGINGQARHPDQLFAECTVTRDIEASVEKGSCYIFLSDVLLTGRC